MNANLLPSRPKKRLELWVDGCSTTSSSLAPLMRCHYLDSPSPPDRTYAKEYANNLQAQINMAPKLYAAKANEQYGDPAYTRLQLRNLNTAANGDATTPGFLSIFGQAAPVLQRIAEQSTSSQRSADIADVARLGASAREAMRSTNPQSYGLVDTLTNQAQGELAAGSRLTPAEQAQVEESTRRTWAQRGLGGESAAAAETLGTLGAGRAALDRRRMFASGVVGLNQSVYGDPFQQVLNKQSGTTSASMQALQGAAGQVGQSAFNPESVYAGQLNSQNQQLGFEADSALANNRNAVTMSAIKAGTAFAGGMGV